MQHLNEQDGKVTVVMEETFENWVAMNQMLSYAFLFNTTADPGSKPEAFERSDPHTRIATYAPDGTMVAGLQVVQEDIYLKGRPIKHGGIKAVASLPWSRRQGNVGMTLVGACCHMREQGMPVSSLYPFSYSFYRRFGWELGQRSLHYRVPMAELKIFAKAPGKIERICLASEGAPDPGLERLKSMYGRFAQTAGASFVRSAGWWRYVTLEDLNYKRFVCVYVNERGSDDGYITYSLDRDKGELHAYELIYDSPEALKGLLSFVYTHDSMVKTFSWRAPWGTDLQLLLDNPRVDATLEPGMMFRIVDVLPLLLHCAQDYTGPEFMVKVVDPQLGWNNGVYRVTAGSAAMLGRSVAAEPILELSIDRLSQAACGYATLSSLVKAGLAKASSSLCADMDSLFITSPNYVPFLNDHF